MDFPTLIISIVSVFITIIGLLTIYVKGILALFERVKALEVKVDLWWGSVQKEVIQLLHHPDPCLQRRDELLDKFRDHEITKEETLELRNLVEDLFCKTGTPKDEKMAALLLLIKIDQSLYQDEKPCKSWRCLIKKLKKIWEVIWE